MPIVFKRTTVEEGNEEIYESTSHGLAASIGGGKSDSYKITVNVKAVSREMSQRLVREFEPLLRKIRREMKYDPNQVGLPLDEVDETTDEETGEITAVASTESNSDLAQKVVDTFNEGQVNKPRPVKRATALNSAK
jgi:hypothetical protein